MQGAMMTLYGLPAVARRSAKARMTGFQRRAVGRQHGHVEHLADVSSATLDPSFPALAPAVPVHWSEPDQRADATPIKLAQLGQLADQRRRGHGSHARDGLDQGFLGGILWCGLEPGAPRGAWRRAQRSEPGGGGREAGGEAVHDGVVGQVLREHDLADAVGARGRC